MLTKKRIEHVDSDRQSDNSKLIRPGIRLLAAAGGEHTLLEHLGVVEDGVEPLLPLLLRLGIHLRLPRLRLLLPLRPLVP
jgi:hypothetical protein